MWLVNSHLLFLLLVGAFNPVKFGLAQMFVAIWLFRGTVNYLEELRALSPSTVSLAF